MEEVEVSARPMGKVYLVGAGPGDPRLLTLRGAALLAEADLVLYDGLVNPLLLRLTRGKVERTARAKRDGVGVVPQSQINQRMIEEALKGKTVVRLKGGDPYIFGRGSEEAEALREAGILFEVVPGVTAATGAGEYAGFSFTHREISSAVAFVTGHEDPLRESSRLDYGALARFPGTLVFYMGLGRLEEICTRLIEAGLAESTPAAVVCQASLSSQRVVEGTLRTVPESARSQNLKPPSLIVVGECVTQRSRLSWFERLPLFGMSIGITRPEDQSDEVVDQILNLGGEPVLMPMIEVGPIDEPTAGAIHDVLERLGDFSWLIFTSVNGVSEFFRHLRLAGKDARALGRAMIAAIGTSTARRLEVHGVKADLVPENFRAESLAKALSEKADGKSMLWLRATRGRDVLPKMLEASGVRLEQLPVYRNEDVSEFSPEVLRKLETGSVDWTGLSSPSIARRFREMLRFAGLAPEAVRTRIVAISPVTAEAAREVGLPVDAVAETYTWAGMLAAIQSSRFR